MTYYYYDIYCSSTSIDANKCGVNTKFAHFPLPTSLKKNETKNKKHWKRSRTTLISV